MMHFVQIFTILFDNGTCFFLLLQNNTTCLKNLHQQRGTWCNVCDWDLVPLEKLLQVQA